MHKTVPAHIHTVARGMAEGRSPSVLHVLSGHNRSHKSVIQAQKRAANFLRHMWKAILGASDNVRLICSHSDMMRNTYDVVYDVVYDIV